MSTAMLRTPAVLLRAAQPVRLFSTSPAFRKGPVEGAKDAVKAVDRTVSDAAVKGIEKGQEAAASAKAAAGMGKGEAEGKAAELAGQAKGKAEELKGAAKGKAEEVKGKI